MKAQHAAALALVGWYLILPPIKPTSANVHRSTGGAWATDVRAKLKDWQIVEGFDDAADCEIARDEAIEDSQSKVRKPSLGSGYFRAFHSAESQAQCINANYSRSANRTPQEGDSTGADSP